MKKTELKGAYDLRYYDDAIPDDMQQEIYDYAINGTYCVNTYDPPHFNWNPKNDTWERPHTKPGVARMPLAWDEESLKLRSPLVHKLWLAINDLLDNKYELAGVPEGMNYMIGISPLNCLPRPDGSPGARQAGWRAWISCNFQELKYKTKSVHRDNIYLDLPGYYTLVYFVNKEWHPQLYGETVFHGNDAGTGDYTGKFDKDQNRGFPIGDPENIVCPRPGRIMMFDSRYLHQIKPANSLSPEGLFAIPFRIRVKGSDDYYTL